MATDDDFCFDAGLTLPRRYQLLAGRYVQETKAARRSWSIVTLEDGDEALVVAASLASAWAAVGIVAAGAPAMFTFEGKKLGAIVQPRGSVQPLEARSKRPGRSEALAFATALAKTRSLTSADIGDGLFLSGEGIVAPTSLGGAPEMEKASPGDCGSGASGDAVALGRYLTGGVTIDARDVARIVAINPALAVEDAENALRTVGLSADSRARKDKPRNEFRIAGRRGLTAFFREHVIDIVEKPEAYARLGIHFPGGLIMHGRPGTGKTHAAAALASYLGWPAFEVTSGSIGSPYIHETGRRIAAIFEEARKAAPSLLIIDEMEAFLSERSAGGGHRLEEVAEFLRLIPTARDCRILPIGITNRLELIDEAVMRRGRFDHKIEVPAHDEDDVREILVVRFAGLPVADGCNPAAFAGALAGRTIADIDFFASEAARLTARAGKPQLDDLTLGAALRTLGGGPKR